MKACTKVIGGAFSVLAATFASLSVPSDAMADPLTPLSPAENEYLVQVRRVFSQYRDPTEFRSDGELLYLGRFVCHQRESGLVGYEATLVAPAIAQLALVYLCPG